MAALKIALINTFYPPYNFGGDGVYVRRLAHALARRGCEVSILHDTETFRALSGADMSELQSLEEPPGVKVYPLKSRLGAIAPLLTHQFGRPLAYDKQLDEFFAEQFDVTHFHNVSAVGGPGILSRGSGIRLYTAHEHWLVCPTHILWRFDRELCDSRKCFRCQLSYRRPPQIWRHTGFLERKANSIDAFIALSRSSADNHQRFGFGREMTVLPSFIPDLERASVRENIRSKPFVLFAGRLEKLKGLQDVIPAIAKQSSFDLLIAGEGDYRTELEAVAGGAPNISFLGRQTPEALDALYAGAAAVLLPSACYEVFPLVALEAFRAGAPIIARNRGPFPEIIESSGAGFLFDAPEQAVEAARRLVDDGELRRRLGGSARRSFERLWSEDVALSAYFNLVAEKATEKGFTDIAKKARDLTSFEGKSA